MFDGVTKLFETGSRADLAVRKFTKEISKYNSTQCSIGTTQKSTCNLGNIEIEDCNNLTLACCNDANASILSCTSSYINESAVNAMVDSSSNALSSSTLARLDNYLLNDPEAKNPFSKYFNTTTSSVKSKLSTYISTRCLAGNVVEQNVTLPSLKGKSCSSDVVSIYNRSDVQIRCAMGAISHLLPNESMATVEIPKWYVLTKKTQFYLTVLGCLAGAFFVFVLLVSTSKIDSNT